jgi:1-acyl-sn-glycerol-3-phosphate acyltransferase
MILISFIFRIPKLFREANRIFFKYGFDFKENFKDLPNSPCIIVSNYCSKKFSLMSYLAKTMIPVKYVLVTSDITGFFLRRVYEEDRLIFVPHGSRKNYNRVEKEIKEKLSQGYYIFSFVEDIGAERNFYKIKKIRSGMFRIAKNLNVPIVPVVIDTAFWCNCIFLNPEHRMIFGEKIFVNDIEKDMENVLKWMQRKLNILSIKN